MFQPLALRTARQAAGLTQGDLAKIASVSQSHLSKFESGTRSPDPEVIDRLASSLGVLPAFFARSTLEGALPPLYRRQRVGVKAMNTWEAELALLQDQLRLLAFEVSVEASIELPRMEVDEDEDGPTPRAVASRIREHLRIGPGPVQHLCRAIERTGVVIVVSDAMPAKVAGVSIPQMGGAPDLIVVRQNLPTDRFRFTVAHEFVHLCLNHHRFRAWDRDHRQIEDYTNAVAARLILSEGVERRLARVTQHDLISLRAEYGVSMRTLVRLARDIGSISDASYHQWNKTLMVRYRYNEPGRLQEDRPQTLNRVLDVLVKAGYSRDDVAALSMSTTEAFERRFAAHIPWSTSRNHLRIVT